MLERLPKEIYWSVLDQLPNRIDLKHLCAVSKTLNDSTVPKFYEYIDIGCKSEKNLDAIHVQPFLGSNASSRLRHVKHVRVSAPFRDNLEGRCIHYESVDGPHRFQTLADSALPVFEQLKDESLISFSWSLGTCISAQILGPEGYLPLKQASVEELNLVTGSGCFCEDDNSNDIDLSRFRNIRRISWAGLGTDSHFETLHHALLTNSKRLTHLRLEYADQPEEDFSTEDLDIFEGGDQEIYYGICFARGLLGLKRPFSATLDILFPSLTSLSLESVPLINGKKSLVHALNVSQLLHLTLRKCSAMEDFLREIVAAGQPLKLLSLEYICDSDGEISAHEALEGILKLGANLTDLFLSLPGPLVTLNFWRKLADNRPPLKRFVYHQRAVNTDEDSSRYEEEEDLTDLSLLREDVDELASSGENHPFAQFDLTCLGLGGHFYGLSKILQHASATRSLKILHVRRSGVDLMGSMVGRGRVFENSDSVSDPDDMYDYGDEEDHDTRMSEGSAPKDIGEDDVSKSSSDISSEIDDPKEAAYKDAMSELKAFPENLLPFARWAFGPEGIQSLQVLAYGDFSYDGRFKEANRILCRKSWKVEKRYKKNIEDDTQYYVFPFQPMREVDIEMEELFNENLDFLAACPVDSLVVK